MKLRTLIGFCALLAACGFAPPLRAQPDDVESPTDEQLRRVAEDILAGGEFQHFEHFERQPPSPVPADKPETADANAKSSEQQSAQDRPWWERLHQRRASQKSSTGESTSPSKESGSPASGSSESKSERGGGSRGDAAAQPSPGTKPGDQPPPSETAARSNRPERPAQRGSDGIVRPVRHAAKTPRPRTELSGPDWDLGFMAPIAHFLGLMLHFIAYAALAAVVVLILALAARAIAAGWSGRSRRGATGAVSAVPLSHDRSPGETAADVFLQQALLLAGRREYREALGQLLLGAMSYIESREWIRYRRGLTVRDYLRCVRGRPEQFAGLKVVVDAYEPVEYGRHPATQSVFESALEGYRDGFASTETA